MSGGVDPTTLSPEELNKLLSQMPPEQLAQIPAGIAPYGQQSNLINPRTTGYHVIAVTGVLTAIMLVCVILRFYVVLRIKRRMSPDDWATIPSALGAVYYFIVVCISVEYLKFGTHLWDLSLLHIRSPLVPKISFLSNFPAFIIFPIIKTTFFLMYLQLFRPLRWLRICAYVGLVITWCFYISAGVSQLAFTLPAPGQTWAETFASPRYLRAIELCVPTSSFSLVLDTYILVLPIIAISSLQLKGSKKIGAAAMFSTGFICCAASSVAVYFQYTIWRNQSDYTYWVIFVLLAYSVEMCVGICTSCMPSLARLHKHGKNKGGQQRSGLFSFGLGSTISKMLKSNNTSSDSKSSTMDKSSSKSSYMNIEESVIESHEMNNRSYPTPMESDVAKSNTIKSQKSRELNTRSYPRESTILKSNTITQSWSKP